jgi:hypothetical protein
VTARPLDAARDALIALQGQLIAMPAVQNVALAGRVGELEERLARLECAASRNSGNSSLPPSLDDQPGRTPPAGKAQRGRRGKRNPGKQPGARRLRPEGIVYAVPQRSTHVASQVD